MKKAALLFFFILSGVFCFAQGLQLGVRAGINSGTLSTKLPGVTEGKVQTGFVGGVFGRASLLGFFAQPEINFSQRKGAFQMNSTNETYTNTLNYMDINLMLGYSLAGVARFNFGPSFMTLLSASQKGDAGAKDGNFSKDYFSSTAWGFQVGAGIDIGKLCLDIRYDFNLSDLGKNGVNSAVPAFGANADYRTSHSIWQFTLGYKIIKI